MKTMARRSSCRCENYRANPRVRFYKSLRGYVKTLIVLLALGIFLDNDFFEVFGIVALFWGIAIVMKAIRLNGIPGTSGWLSDDWYDWINRRYDDTPINVPGATTKPNEGEDYDPLWKDKDLV